MTGDRVFIVHLRRPRTKTDGRHDPFWEFGSFGITGCHGSNLMKLEKAERLNGARLAFAQGGSLGTRLVYLTPPVHVVLHAGCAEAKWPYVEMPFRYAAAPILANNEGSSDFTQLEKTLLGNRDTPEGQFASLFRSRAQALDSVIAKELIRKYQVFRSKAPAASIATNYHDALPRALPSPDRNRKRTYSQWLKNPGASPSELALADAYIANKCRNQKLSKEFIHAEAELRIGERRKRTGRIC